MLILSFLLTALSAPTVHLKLHPATGLDAQVLQEEVEARLGEYQIKRSASADSADFTIVIRPVSDSDSTIWVQVSSAKDTLLERATSLPNGAIPAARQIAVLVEGPIRRATKLRPKTKKTTEAKTKKTTEAKAKKTTEAKAKKTTETKRAAPPKKTSRATQAPPQSEPVFLPKKTPKQIPKQIPKQTLPGPSPQSVKSDSQKAQAPTKPPQENQPSALKQKKVIKTPASASAADSPESPTLRQSQSIPSGAFLSEINLGLGGGYLLESSSAFPSISLGFHRLWTSSIGTTMELDFAFDTGVGSSTLPIRAHELGATLLGSASTEILGATLRVALGPLIIWNLISPSNSFVFSESTRIFLTGARGHVEARLPIPNLPLEWTVRMVTDMLPRFPQYTWMGEPIENRGPWRISGYLGLGFPIIH